MENRISDAPLVSVCINAYNAEKFIRQTLESVLNQTYRNLQVIVVDDASPDGTVDVIRESFDDDRLEVYVRKQNYHISYTCNEAISHVRGEYVFHIDSDDVISAGVIEREVAFLEENTSVAACFTQAEIIDENGNMADSSFDDLRAVFTFAQKTQADFLHQFFYGTNCLLHSGSMVRKSVLDEIGGHDLALSYLHDFDLWTRIIIKYPIHVLEEPLTFYRVADGFNHSKLNEKTTRILDLEAVFSIYRMIDRCPDDLFLEAFGDALRLKGAHTHEEIEIEKAFLLLNAPCMPEGNPYLGVKKFHELFREKQNVELALSRFGFSLYDLLKLEEQQVFYNASETDGYEKTIRELRDGIDALARQNARCRRTVEYAIYAAVKKAAHGVKHLHHFLAPAQNGVRYKKKIFLYGYFGTNLGDDLFFDAILNRYPDVLFFVLYTPEYYAFFHAYPNVKFYTYSTALVSKINRIGDKLRVHDLFERLLLLRTNGVVHIGGSIYQQTQDYLRDYQLRRRRFSRPYFSISSNFGQYHSDDFYVLWKKAFQKAEDICFRDTYSQALFQDVDSVRYAPDVLFSFRCAPAEVVPGSVAVSVIDPSYKYRNFSAEECAAYKKAVIATVTALAGENRSVRLLGFCKLEGDGAFIEQLLAALPYSVKRNVQALAYDGENKDRLIELLASSEYIIGTRLHAVILGLAMGKKVLPVIYDTKIEYILSDVRFTGKKVYLKDMPAYKDAGLAPLLNETAVTDVSPFADAQDRQFARLDKFLNRRPQNR